MPYERIRYTDRFGDTNLPGEMQTTESLKQVSCGTELTIVQEGLPDAIPTEACYFGWQESLALLANLVERRFQGNEYPLPAHAHIVTMAQMGIDCRFIHEDGFLPLVTDGHLATRLRRGSHGNHGAPCAANHRS